MANNKCDVCIKLVLDSDDGLQCDSACQRWFHIKCVGVNKSEYNQYASNNNKKWYCSRVDCTAVSVNPSQELMLKMDKLLDKFSELCTKDELKKVTDGIDDIKTDINNICAKLSTFEPRLEKVEAELALLKADADERKAAEKELSEPKVETLLEELTDRQRRSRNIIVYGVKESQTLSPESAKKTDKEQVSLILKTAGLETALDKIQFFRLGKKTTPPKARPLKICMPTEADAVSVFRHFGSNKELKGELEGVSLAHDRTISERKHLSALLDSLNARTKAGEKDLTLKYTNGVPKIVKKN